MVMDDHITVHRHLDHAHVVLVGDFDIAESEALVDLSTGLFSQLTATVEVDMFDVTFFGSRALAALLQLSNEVARHSGAEMRITRSNELVRRILELTGVLDRLALDDASGATPMSDVA
jgi:anti-anti-sigma factor